MLRAKCFSSTEIQCRKILNYYRRILTDLHSLHLTVITGKFSMNCKLPVFSLRPFTSLLQNYYGIWTKFIIETEVRLANRPAKMKRGPITSHGSALVERNCSSYSFLPSAVGEGEWSASHPSHALPQKKETPTVPIL
jgi:hypothetical protein